MLYSSQMQPLLSEPYNLEVLFQKIIQECENIRLRIPSMITVVYRGVNTVAGKYFMT